jgi:hypothetical protein
MNHYLQQFKHKRQAPIPGLKAWACGAPKWGQLSGFDEALVIRRYLMKDKSVIPSPELLECHRELLQEKRYFEKSKSSASITVRDDYSYSVD